MKRSSSTGGGSSSSNSSKKMKSSKTLNGNSIDDKVVKVVYISNPMRVTTSAAMFRGIVQKLTGRDSNLGADDRRIITAPHQQQTKHAAVASPSSSGASEEVVASAAAGAAISSSLKLSSSRADQPPPSDPDMIFSCRFLSGESSSYDIMNYNDDRRDNKYSTSEMMMAAAADEIEGFDEGGDPMQMALEGSYAAAAGFFVSPNLYQSYIN